MIIKVKLVMSQTTLERRIRRERKTRKRKGKAQAEVVTRKEKGIVKEAETKVGLSLNQNLGESKFKFSGDTSFYYALCNNNFSMIYFAKCYFKRNAVMHLRQYVSSDN